MNNDIEISKPETPTTASSSFAERLRTALTALAVGQAITLRSIKERTYITNMISQTQKKTGMRFKTKLLIRREVDPEGKLVLEIKRIEARTPVES